MAKMDKMTIIKNFEKEYREKIAEYNEQRKQEEEKSVQAVAQFMASEKREIKR